MRVILSIPYARRDSTESRPQPVNSCSQRRLWIDTRNDACSVHHITVHSCRGARHGQDQHRSRRSPDPGGTSAVQVPVEAGAHPSAAHRATQERPTARLAVAPRPGEMGRRSRRAATPPTVIVVDTTVWIDFLEARGTAFDRHLTELVETDAPIALVDIVYREVLQGIGGEHAYRRTRASVLAHPDFRPRGVESVDTAVNLYGTA